MKQNIFFKLVLSIMCLYLANVYAQSSGPWDCYNIGQFKKQTIQGYPPTYHSGVPYDYGKTVLTSTTVLSRSIWYFTIPTSLPQGAYITKVEFKYQNKPSQNGYFTLHHLPQDYVNPTSSDEQLWNISEAAVFLKSFSGTTGNPYTYEIPELAQIVRDAITSNKSKIYLGIRANPEVGSSNVIASAFQLMQVTFTYEIRATYTIKNNFEAGQVKVNGELKNSGFTDGFITNANINLEAVEPQYTTNPNYTWIWNDSEAPNKKSEWGLLNGGIEERDRKSVV